MTQTKSYPIAPFPKPRPRASVVHGKRRVYVPSNYKRWKAGVNRLGVTLPTTPLVIFHVAMPPSWSKAKRERMLGRPHQQKPDLDNFVKALFDACEVDDSHIWAFAAYKTWAQAGAIVIGALENGEDRRI